MGQVSFKQESRCAFHNDEDRDSGSKRSDLEVCYSTGAADGNALGSFFCAHGGLSNFVPYLSPILAAISVGLVAMPLDLSMLIWIVGIYTVIQPIEGYAIGPLIQRQAGELPPAWALLDIVLFGS